MLAVLATTPLKMAGQWDIGESVVKDVLTRTLPADENHFGEPLELVGASTGELTVMVPRFDGTELRGGIAEQREVFVTRHARQSVRGAFSDVGVAAVRGPNSLLTVAFVAETELGFVERLETMAPPTEGARVELLHIRYAQTGSGGVTEDLLYALDAAGRLVPVPIEAVDLSDGLQPDEYLCCGRFTSFDEEAVELTVYVTRSGRSGITDRLRVSYRLEGRFRRDEVERTYVPDFRLVPLEPSEREPL